MNTKKNGVAANLRFGDGYPPCGFDPRGVLETSETRDMEDKRDKAKWKKNKK
tara:strand:- start:225 stop:380 length:156 start_codon:yes stop_codon:yes gene_type:complete